MTAQFGEIFEAAWLFDIAVEDDAVRLKSYQLPTRSGGGLGYKTGPTNEDFVLGHGERFSLAILVSDDCHAETVCMRAGRGRLLLAPLEPLASPEEYEAAAEETKQHFGRLTIEPISVCPN